MHHVPYLKPVRLLSFAADEAGTHGDCQDLATFVGMPERASARSKANIVAHAVISHEDGIHVDCAGKGLSRLP